MKRFTKNILAMACAALAILPTGAVGQAQADSAITSARFMRVYDVILPPIGFVQFCDRHPSDCRGRGSDRRRVKLTDKRWRQLVVVNNTINRKVAPVTDQELYGRLEVWTYPTNKGDCEDYVLLKRRELLGRGWPESALLITVVRDENGDGHAVLTVRTSQGDFLLDNKRDIIVPWHQSAYSFVKRQSYRDPGVWMSLTPNARFSVSSARTR